MKLKVENVACSFDGSIIMKDVNIGAEKGQFVSILGPSGCGKSTLLNIISGVFVGDRGDVFVDDKKVEGISEHFAYMPQQDLLFPWKNILENVCLYGKINGCYQDVRQKALESFEKFGLAGYEKKYPSQLSGGMRQRAAFLRTAMCKAEILLLDEPFGALDVITRGQMQDWLLDIKGELDRTIVMVTHDIDEAIYLSDKIYVLAGKPAGIVAEINVSSDERSKEWLFRQQELKNNIYHLLQKGL